MPPRLEIKQTKGEGLILKTKTRKSNSPHWSSKLPLRIVRDFLNAIRYYFQNRPCCAADLLLFLQQVQHSNICKTTIDPDPGFQRRTSSRHSSINHFSLGPRSWGHIKPLLSPDSHFLSYWTCESRISVIFAETLIWNALELARKRKLLSSLLPLRLSLVYIIITIHDFCSFSFFALFRLLFQELNISDSFDAGDDDDEQSMLEQSAAPFPTLLAGRCCWHASNSVFSSSSRGHLG